MSIDVEGWDYEILSAIDFDNSRPTILCIESISFSANGNGVKDDRINSLLSENGYMLYADTNINSIFILNFEENDCAKLMGGLQEIKCFNMQPEIFKRKIRVLLTP